MGLKRVANFFARTPLYGWNGTAFVNTGCKGALQPYDRFVSEREFGAKRRMLLVNPDTPIPSQYTVVRLNSDGPIYMVGWLNKDVQDDQTYSLIYLLHQVTETGQLIALVKNIKASGMVGVVTDNILGTWHCNSERITFNNSREFNEVRITDATLTLPNNCPVTIDHEFAIGNSRYVIQEVYKTSGLLQVRAQLKYT